MYQLNINIDSQGLQNIYSAAQYVTISQGSGSNAIAWITFQPFQANQVSWVEQYYLYASTTVLQPGASIFMMSQTDGPAQFGYIYTLQQGMFTAAPGGANALNAANAQQNGVVLGVAQAATVNGVSIFSPTLGVSTLLNQEATFTPANVVNIFLSSYSNNGVVLPEIPSNALRVALTSQEPVANIGFNDATSSFYLVNQSAAFLSFENVAQGKQLEAS
ncbi:MAG TPA: hypothetical protein VKB93_03890 [Thermoanaerobaculia bacterium]|nr:hypothetical protein [Thermoanaerobaculia bacterium]